MHNKKIIFFSESQTIRKIIEYSLEHCSAELEDGSIYIPKHSQPSALIIFDSNLINSPQGPQWETFLLEMKSPLIVLDSGLESKSSLLKPIQNRRIILRKPFERDSILRSLQDLGLPFSPRIKGAETESYEAMHFNIPASFQEQLRKEALAFVSEYCKSHFRNIAEEVLSKEIRRLTEERNTFLDEA